MMGVLLALNLVGFLVIIPAPNPLILGALLVATGVVNAPVIATFYVLIEELAPAGTVTEAFTWISTKSPGAKVICSSLGGLIRRPAARVSVRARADSAR